jgi:thiosulfate dehydrogenase [quinone] large subunit
MDLAAVIRPGRRLQYSGLQLTFLVALRMLIGWHFLYEGIVKLINPYWTGAPYLAEARGLLAGLFHGWAADPGMMAIVDFLNVWGLILIGLGLLFGLLTRPATIAGAVLILLYYVANPPLLGFHFSMPTEGSYLIVNKNLIEFCALLVLTVFPTGHEVGFDRLLIRTPPPGVRGAITEERRTEALP